MKKLSIKDFVCESLKYMKRYPMRAWNGHFKSEKAEGDSLFTIVRGKEPMAAGKRGNVIGFVRETQSSSLIESIALIVVDGKNIKENSWYTLDCSGKVLEVSV